MGSTVILKNEPVPKRMSSQTEHRMDHHSSYCMFWSTFLGQEATGDSLAVEMIGLASVQAMVFIIKGMPLVVFLMPKCTL